MARCTYPAAPHQGRELPDHGELWSAPWETREDEDGLALFFRGRALPYLFEKRIRLLGSGLGVDYELTSTGEEPFAWLWSAHPLLAVEKGDEIELPESVRYLELGWSARSRLGDPGDEIEWPIAFDRERRRDDLRVVKAADRGFADKLFTDRFTEGRCSLLRKRTGESLSLRWPVSRAPYLGIWLYNGGWPAGEGPGHFTVALEPCSGRPDSLEEAMGRTEHATLEALSTVRWKLVIELEGPP